MKEEQLRSGGAQAHLVGIIVQQPEGQGPKHLSGVG